MVSPTTSGQRHERLYRIAYLLTRDWAMAEDVVPHSLVKAWTVWPKKGDDPDRYVYRIIVNTHASWWRRCWRDEVPTEVMPEGPTGRDFVTAVNERDALWVAGRRRGSLPAGGTHRRGAGGGA